MKDENLASIFSISYDFGLKLERIQPRSREISSITEPDVFLASFDCLIVHDYDTHKTVLTGNEKRFDEIEDILREHCDADFEIAANETSVVVSNYTRDEYLQLISEIQECIRCGDTYQTNLTQQISAELPENLTEQRIFFHLRKAHAAPFAAFVKRNTDSIVSISPERFFKVDKNRKITTSPIKGTRPRGITSEEDANLRAELVNSAKDLAENTMIVDLLRNDLGRICELGSIAVEKLCELETHPTLFHLVSTISGELRRNVKFSDILKAVFPCGSITGAPKISTMRIINELETANRGLSMGAIGYSIQNPKFQIENSLDLSVAIRTMTVKNRKAVFNVGGGIVIDSVADEEYKETLVKAKALLQALSGNLI